MLAFPIICINLCWPVYPWYRSFKSKLWQSISKPTCWLILETDLSNVNCVTKDLYNMLLWKFIWLFTLETDLLNTIYARKHQQSQNSYASYYGRQTSNMRNIRQRIVLIFVIVNGICLFILEIYHTYVHCVTRASHNRVASNSTC